MTGRTGTLQLIAGTVPGWQPVQLHGAQHPALLSPRSCRIQGGKEAAVPSFGAGEDGAEICHCSMWLGGKQAERKHW